MNLPLFNRIGGEAAVEAAVNLFYSKFANNEEIKPFFNTISIPEQEEKMRVFLTIVLSGNVNYNRREIREAHAPFVKQGLSDRHFNIFIQMMTESLEELNVPVEFIEEFVLITESFRSDVLLR